MNKDKSLAKIVFLLAAVGLPAFGGALMAQDVADVAGSQPGLEVDVIRLGGVLDLEGRSRGVGRAMRAGIEAALRDQSIDGRRIEFVPINDSFTPQRTIQATNQLLNLGVFVMLGNVGTATAAVSLPILNTNNTPAVGFLTGSELLRPGQGSIINYRASDAQETATVVQAALDAGMAPSDICAYVANDEFGMSGLRGMRNTLAALGDTVSLVSAFDQILSMQGENPARNGIGPVGVYQRNTFGSRNGYQSLKDWENRNATTCVLVVTVGTYNPIAKFVAYSRYKGEVWAVSAVSFTGASNFQEALAEADVVGDVIMTQVVPALDSNIPIVRDARQALGGNLDYVSLEGYIVGRLFLRLASDAGSLTRDSLVAAALGRVFDLGGVRLDFSDDNQGSDLVLTTVLTPAGWSVMQQGDWQQWVQ
jgi:ABC-type branched-subunit amino acid transport system substrate-binding protein